MNHTCRSCGKVQEEKPRFCPFCGSYFIDADDPSDGKEWKGMILPDGTLKDRATASASGGFGSGASVSSKTGAESARSSRAFGILSIIFSSVVLLINLFSLIFRKEDFFLVGIAFFIPGVIMTVKASGKLKSFSTFFLIFSAVIFAIVVNFG